MKIKSVFAREILDSRGNPTVEVDVITENGLARAAVPSGASTGKYEALELRDGKKRYLGQGVMKAVSNVNKIIAPKLKGKDPTRQGKIDDMMVLLDETDNKRRLGANAILGVSMAVCKAGAMVQKKPIHAHIGHLFQTKKHRMPIPSFNIINGGRHAGNKLDFQEFMIQPRGAKSFRESLRIGAEVYHVLKGIILKKYGKNAVNVGDEGGFAPPVDNIISPLNMIMKALRETGYEKNVKIAMDVAASEFFVNGKYLLEGRKLSPSSLLNIYEDLIKTYPIVSIEDPFDQDDIDHFTELTSRTKIQIVGDDFLVTNPQRIQRAIHHDACNALLLKVNQIGSVTEALEAAKLSMDNGWNVMVSHRSGETTDNFIADLCVGIAASQIKSGAPCRGERLSKYNQLLRIEEGTDYPFVKNA